MLRQARIDAPGALHHIIIRGIERKKIFEDDSDRDDFIELIVSILPECKTGCYAWALIPNHAHLLLRTGIVPIATIMRRLLTGDALKYNHRHRNMVSSSRTATKRISSPGKYRQNVKVGSLFCYWAVRELGNVPWHNGNVTGKGAGIDPTCREYFSKTGPEDC
ncbi:MAG: transposase [Deltaproteobacteria bacterium]|nr:transposase [Deltaproteobacteria bacterium]